MEEELQKQESASVQTEQVTSVKQETNQTLESLPRIEDLRKSEQDVKVNTQVQGTTQVEQQTQAKDRVFTRKSDEKKVYFKKRLKIVTAVYTTVVALLLAFAITNTVTLARLDKTITTNTQTIQEDNKALTDPEEEIVEGENVGNFQISLNEPRDYSEDKQELTFLDKLTILFRNIFS